MSGFSFSTTPTFSTQTFGPSFNTTGNVTAAPPANTIMTPTQMVEQFNQILDPNGPYFPFRFAFYTKVDPKDLQRLLVRPPQMPERMWLQALERNPDPKTMVPVLVQDFTGLRDRMNLQQAARESHQKNLKDYKEYAEKLEQNHTISTAVRIENFKRKQMELTSRVVHLMIKLELLRSRGQSVTRDEEQFRMQLENVQRELNQPNQYKAVLNEVISTVRMQEESGPVSAYPELQDEDLQKFHEILFAQGQGLAALLGLIKKDTDDINVMLHDYHKSLDAVGK